VKLVNIFKRNTVHYNFYSFLAIKKYAEEFIKGKKTLYNLLPSAYTLPEVRVRGCLLFTVKAF
jgi:hypothetical protein